jgi:hypothetical protein
VCQTVKLGMVLGLPSWLRMPFYNFLEHDCGCLSQAMLVVGLDQSKEHDGGAGLVWMNMRSQKMVLTLSEWITCGISWVYHGISMDYVSMSYLLMPLKNGSTWIFLELTFSKLDSSIPQKRRNTSGPFTAQKNTRTWGFDLGCTSYQISWWIWVLSDVSPSDIWVTFPPRFSLYIPEGAKTVIIFDTSKWL